MRKHWLLFTQTVTIALALVFVIHALKPELLPSAAHNTVVTLYENPQPAVTEKPVFTGFSTAATKAMPSVVNVYTTTIVKTPVNPFLDDFRFRFFFGNPRTPKPRTSSSLGSGVIVSSDGYILTNHHVVETADKIEVALPDGRKAKAHVIGSDPETDLAVIKIRLPGELPTVTFGHPEQARVGDMVLAIGNPFGVGQTVTMGIISALKRNHLGLNTFENFIQTDAAINPGNSGGALVDADGNLIGVNSAIYSPSGGSLGIGFAISANTAKKIMEQIIRYGSVTRGWIGVGVQELTPDLSDSLQLDNAKGVLITEVIRRGPADRAGIRNGDVLVAIDGKPVNNWNAMLETIADMKPGTTATISLTRDAKPLEKQVKIGKRPKQPTQ